jgi:putative transposase
MGRFRKLSQTIWHCHYHILWTPKYRYRVIAGEIADEVNTCIRAFSEHLNCHITVALGSYAKYNVSRYSSGYCTHPRTFF